MPKTQDQSGAPPKGTKYYHPEHVLARLTKDQYSQLDNFVRELIEDSSSALSRFREQMQATAQEINGVVELSETDRQLWNQWKNGNPVAPPPVNPQLTKSHLADATTFLMTTLAADSGIWTALADPDKQSRANAVADRLSQDADNFNHYGAIEAAFNNGLRYNLGGVFCEWIDSARYQPQPSMTGIGATPQLTTVDGNCLRAFDPFNFFCDTTCAPHELGSRGEYAGEFTLMPRRDIYSRFVSGLWTMPSRDEEYDPYARQVGDYQNYRTLLSTESYLVTYSSSSDEVDVIYITLFPALWGLPVAEGDENVLETWKFERLPMYGLVNATPIGRTGLPVAAWEVDTSLRYDCHGSIATQLLPFQRFISYVFSGYQKALMKNINGGFTLYDAQKINVGNISSAATLGGVVPVNPGIEGGLRDAFVNIQPSVDLSHIQSDVSLALDLMQRIFPTDMLRQVADLQRATQYQAAATVQASNRRNLMIAKSIDAMMMTPLRRMMVENILNNVPQLTIIDQTGRPQSLDISQFTDIDLQYSIKNGLAGLDKLGISSALMSAIDRVIQSQVASQEFDMMKALTYYMQLSGSKIDFNAFRRTVPPMPATPEVGAGGGAPGGGATGGGEVGSMGGPIGGPTELTLPAAPTNPTGAPVALTGAEADLAEALSAV